MDSGGGGRSGSSRRSRRPGRGRRGGGHGRQRSYEPQEDPGIEWAELEARSMDELQALATELGVQPNGEVDTTKELLINLIVQARNEREGSLFLEGVLEIVDEGYGFLRRDAHWMPSPEDVYVSQSQIRRFSLRTGDLVSGQVRPARQNDRYHGLVRVVAVNGLDPGARAQPPAVRKAGARLSQ